ncbi:Lsr2 family DNA-binding protein [Paractinoplanes ferrugineus]|nr:BRCT domain-containing protein [Actinoplanes ferrugineus]
MAVVFTDTYGSVEEEFAAPPADRLAGRTLAGHHVAFWRRFVGGRAWLEMPVLCTCEASPAHQPHLVRRRLRDCCAAAGVAYDATAGALGDARATAGLLRAYLRPADTPPARPAEPVPCGVLAALLGNLPLDDILGPGATPAEGGYLELVAQAVEEGGLGRSAVAGLVEHARAIGVERPDRLHRGLVPALARAAVAGGVAAGAVRNELVTVAELLGVPPGGVKALLAEADGELIDAYGRGFRPLPPDWPYGEPLRAGQAVAFTGGEPYRRSRLELAAQLAGLRVVNSVSAGTAVLVSGHPRPRSPKGMAAQRAGTRVVTPKLFEKLAAHVQPDGPARTAVTSATIRAWARAHGHLVAPRGRLPRHVHDAFRAAQQDGRPRGAAVPPTLSP